MFYGGINEEEKVQLNEISRSDRHRWLVTHLNNPSMPVNIDDMLLVDEQIKFKLVCSLRFAQMTRD